MSHTVYESNTEVLANHAL